ncbi:CDP-Glycerol:Poly(glycerophosphate) glycerophosphotransferase [Desulfonatronum thiosulfatophilum]|uniref:CDP-Glycerol:Poly(Glycerophosphate) glycerophosphotransferase n=1 Tax=Desulfonatronum thiosulfatophilum TaxID=617002 RepID=A0A1G6DUY7_9BACT|nr:CDP-glycerol glycerophosphotransferase family protein [Desulfonatronum thiosulfatophilum]SDB48912.1 CDP-Glycerol:Poly(glycerophosphate) glycerophosphotransferase [Desulfonatronum thiosulfatophilum]
MKIDFLAWERHHFDHLAPIWHKIPDDFKGFFYVITSYDKLHDFRGISLVKDISIANSFSDLNIDNDVPEKPIVISTFYKVDFLTDLRRPIFYVEHGAGQTYIGSQFYNFERKNVVLDILPSHRLSNIFRMRYPFAKKVIVGCPLLDKWHKSFFYPSNRMPVVAISFHFERPSMPETKSSFPYFRVAVKNLSQQKKWKILGHGHPRIINQLAPIYEMYGIEVVKNFEDVMERADIYVCDNSSTLFEFASTDRPVVVLNAPWYRRDVEHGLRFWEHADIGVNCDHPDDLFNAIELALSDPCDQKKRRKKAVEEIYAYTDGEASNRAAQAIVTLAGSIFDKPLFLYPGTSEESINTFLSNNDVAIDFLAKKIEYHQLESLKYLHRFKEGEHVHMKDMEFHVWAIIVLLMKCNKNIEALKVFNESKSIFSYSEYLLPIKNILQCRLNVNNDSCQKKSFLRIAEHFSQKGMIEKAAQYFDKAKHFS